MKLSLFRNSKQSNPSQDPPTDRIGSPSYLPEKHANPDYIQYSILNHLFLVAVLSGTIICAANLPSLLQESQWMAIGLMGLMLLVLIAAAFLSRLAYTLRATILLIAIFALGLSSILTDRFYGGWQIFLLALPFFAAHLTGSHGRKASLTISIGAVCLFGALIITGQLPQPDLRLESGNQSLISWFVLIANFSLLAVGGAFSAGIMLSGLQNSLKNQYIQTQEMANERARLESQIQKRTEDLQRRLVQIRTAAEINRAISQMLNIDQLLPQVCELVSQHFGLYYAGIFLIEYPASQLIETHDRLATDFSLLEDLPDPIPIDDNSVGSENQSKIRTYAILKAGSGEAGRQMLANGHKLLVGGDSMIGWATANHEARIAQNVGEEIVRFNNPYLPLTRSELALPILIHDEITNGSLQNRESQVERILGAMTIQSSEEAAFDQDDILILQSIADSLASAIENSRLFASTEASLKEIRTLHRQYLQQAWQQEKELRGEIAYSYERGDPSPAQSQANDILEIPIRLRDQVIGSLTVEPCKAAGLSNVDQPAWTIDDLVLVKAVTDQAALALENARLLEETQRRAQSERLISEITGRLRASLDMETVLKTAVQEFGKRLGMAQVEIKLAQVSEVKSESCENLRNYTTEFEAASLVNGGKPGGNGRIINASDHLAGRRSADASEKG